MFANHTQGASPCGAMPVVPSHWAFFHKSNESSTLGQASASSRYASVAAFS